MDSNLMNDQTYERWKADYCRKYYEDNKEKLQEYASNYQKRRYATDEEFRNARKQRARDYNQSHREVINQRRKERYHTDPEFRRRMIEKSNRNRRTQDANSQTIKATERYRNDPDYRQRVREAQNARHMERWENDPEYRERLQRKNRESYNRNRNTQ